MKRTLIALAVMVAGTSTGCAQVEYLQNPANYRVNELNGKRMYCHGDSRDNYTICEGWKSPAQIAQKAEQAKIAEENAKFPGLSADPQNNQGGGEVRSGHFCYGDRRDDALWQCAGYETPAQIAQKAEQAKIAEENARIAAKKQAMSYGTTKEREALVYASLNRVRAAQGDELLDSSGGYAMTDEERDLIHWVETPNVTVAEMKNTLRVREIKMIAAAKKEAAYAASPAGKLKAKREAEAQAKREAEAINALFGKNGMFGAAIENYNNMTPEQRARFHEKNEERQYQQKLIQDQERRVREAEQRAKDDRRLFCIRNFKRSC